MSASVKRDEVVQSIRAVSDLVIPVYSVLPLTQFAVNPPPQPIPGRQGAIAYQQSDDDIYYCDGTQWLPFCTGGSQGFQGAQGVQGSQGFQGGLGPQGFQGFQGAQGAQGTQGAQGFQGAQGIGSSPIHLGSSGFIDGVVGPQTVSTVGLGLGFGGDVVPSPDMSTGAIWFRASRSGIFRNLFVTAIIEPDSVPYPATGTATLAYDVAVATPGPVDPVIPPTPYVFNFAASALATVPVPFSFVAPGQHVISVSNIAANVVITAGTLYALRQTVTGITPADTANFSVGAGFELV